MRPVRFFALIGIVAFLVHTPSSSNSLSNVSSINETAKTYETGPECAPCSLNSAVNSVGNGPPGNSATVTPAAALLAQFSQQGPKLVGMGAVGPAYQGYSVSLSGNARLGLRDSDRTGAACAWTRSLGVWTQPGAKLIGSDLPDGFNVVSLSGDGTSWTTVNSGLTTCCVISLVIDPSTPATRKGGVSPVSKRIANLDQESERRWRGSGKLGAITPRGVSLNEV